VIDGLQAQIAIALFRVRLHRAALMLHTMETRMTPKFKGVASAMQNLGDALDHSADGLLTKIAKVDERRVEVFAKSHARLDSAIGELAEVDGYLDDLEKTNGAPSGPLPQEFATKVSAEPLKAAPDASPVTSAPPPSSKAWLD
jgi:hypothetical protein